MIHLETLGVESASHLKDFSRGEAIFQQLQPSFAIFRLETGRASLQRRTADDRLVVLHRARKSEYFAEAALYSDVYHCDAIAETNCTIRIFPKVLFLAQLRSDAVFSEKFAALLARQLQNLRARLEIHHIRSARERLLHYIALIGKDGKTLCIDEDLQAIAFDIGLTREAFYRCLAALEAENVIHRVDAEITILR